jgi:3-oxoacyl-[acyl-carrier-protein] synthase-3
MQLGYGKNGNARSYLDYATLAEAESDGAFALRQDIRLLPNLFDVAVHEYAKLVHEGHVNPREIDHLLCHYSSEKFAPLVENLLEQAQLSIPRQRWYNNLVQRGNTGAASIFIMLADFLRTDRLKLGDKVLCFVPESGRFSVAFMLLTAVEPSMGTARRDSAATPPPVAAETAGVDSKLALLLTELATIWHEYRSRLWRTGLVRQITSNRFDRDTYLRWMECWIPQVREGSKWMREAARNLQPPYSELASLVEEHAGEERDDYQILFDDYKALGGQAGDIDALRRNPGGEALNAFMFAKAKGDSAIGLLGAIYIIEGTGQRVIPALLPILKKQLRPSEQKFRFLTYHGENDIRHLARWTDAVRHVLTHDDSGRARADIVRTARQTAELYLMQFDHVL